MKKSLVSVTALLALSLAASSAFAVGNTINWNNCIGNGAVPSVVFDCANFGGPYSMILELQPPALTGWFATDISMDLQAATAVLNTFWNMSAAGCNSTGISISADRSTLLPAPVGCIPTFTGSTGGSVSSLITAYGTGFGGANRARILVTVARSASSPINSTGTANYYMSHIKFNTDNASENTVGTCNGCGDAVSIVYNSSTLYAVAGAGSNSPEAQQVEVDGPGLGSNCAALNGGGVGVCAATPTLNKTWGQLKSLYR